MDMEPKYKRILLKLSGEALAGEKKGGLDFVTMKRYGEAIKKCVDAGVQVGIVVGYGQNKSRPYRYACNCNERTCGSRCS